MNRMDLKSAFRNLSKKKLFAFVNMGGLTFGLLCALFIGTYVMHELSYDRFYPDADRIYRANINRDRNGQKEVGVLGPTGLKAWMGERLDQVELSARVQRTGPRVANIGNEYLKERNGFYADKEFFGVFGIQLTEGNESTALVGPEALVLSEKLRDKYFGNQPALGQSLELSSPWEDGPQQYVVTGVYADMPGNAHFRPDFLFSFEKLRLRQKRPVDEEWTNFNAFTYLKLRDGVEASQVEALMVNSIVENSTQYDMSGNEVWLQPIKDIHMQDFVAFGDLPGQVQKSTIYILLGIGGLILSLVCINFFNLSTARSLERAKEVGVRKSVGASCYQLIRLYLSEAAVQVVFSMVLALILFEVSGNYFSSLLNTNTDMNQMAGAFGIANFAGLVILLSVLLILGAGFYPALVLSGFRPVDSLKGRVKLNSSKFSLGKVLLVMQFTITLVISIVASIIYSQVSFMENTDPGYARNGTVSFQLINTEQLTRFGERLADNPGVASVTFGDDNIWQIFNSSSDYGWEGKPEDEEHRVYRLSVDDNFIAAMGLTLLEGRSFDEKLVSDSTAVILNESAAKLMGVNSLENFPTIKKGEDRLNVVGIVKDFKAGDFRQDHKPLVLYRNPGRFFKAYVRLNTADVPTAMKNIQEDWKQVMPEEPFEYQFLDDAYERILAKDRQTSQVLLSFTVLSVLISFIGLFGMIRLRVQNRLKEMGIRKILGANFRQVLMVVSKEFSTYLLLAVVAGIPVAVILGRSWLDEFADRISISFTQPFVVVVAMLFIGLVTLLFSTTPLNKLNLVDTLKEE